MARDDANAATNLKGATTMFSEYTVRRVTFVFVGIIIAGLGISINRLVNWGIDPWSTLSAGLSMGTGVSFGTIMLALNLVILVPIFLISRQLVNLGTVVNMVLLGYASDFFVWLLAPVMGTEILEANTVLRVGLMLVGIVVTCFGCALYMRPNLGAGPYDAIGWAIEKATNKKFTYRWNRICTDVLAAGIGFLFGATLGVVTIVMAFMTGPLVQWFTNTAASYLVYGKKGSEVDADRAAAAAARVAAEQAA